MIFRSTSGVDLDFELDGVRYGVPVAGTVEIPDRVAYCVKAHSLPLVEHVPEPEDTSARIGSYNFDPPKPIRKKN